MDTHISRFLHFVIETYGSFLLTVSIFSVKEGSSSESEERREYWGLRRGLWSSCMKYWENKYLEMESDSEASVRASLRMVVMKQSATSFPFLK